GDAAADGRRRPLPARRRRPRLARACEGIDQGGAAWLRARAAGAGAGLDRAADRRLMRRRTLIAAALAALALGGASAALADPPTPPTTTSSTTTAAQPPSVPRTTPGPGIQVGPPLPADQGGSQPGVQVTVGTESKPAWWDIPGRVRYGIDSWFRGLVTDALNPMLDLIGKTVLAT